MRTRDEKLDLIRGGSALLVLAGHARNFLMVDSAEVVHPSIWTKAFYLLTSLHHESVMVFFVLSGYFVGGSVMNSVKNGRFTWMDYGLARLSRLWVVLIPALLLTFLLDLTGASVVSGAYGGSLHHAFNSGPTPTSPASHDLPTLLGNLVFLQKVVFTVYGTNGPLWSLAYEFWYYVLFPIAACAVWRSGAGRIGFVVLLALLLAFLPKGLLAYGCIWLFGVAVWIFCQLPSMKKWREGWAWKVAGAGMFAATVLGQKAGVGGINDYILGLVFALWMPSLLGAWPRPGWWSTFSVAVSEISFSLYIIHFPIMFLIASVGLKGRLLQPSLEGLCWFAGMTLICLIGASGFWWAFEQRTGAARAWLKALLNRSSATTLKPESQ